jgi:hypothetical protein
VGEKKMKKWYSTFAACLLLASCAQFDKECRQCVLDGFDPRSVRQPNPLLPNVFVVRSRYLVVDQEPIRLSKSEIGKDGWITVSWALAAGTPYVFKEKIGIDFVTPRKGKDTLGLRDLDCDIKGEQRKIYVCRFKPTPGAFKYAINVVNRDNPGEIVETLDPYLEGNY